MKFRHSLCLFAFVAASLQLAEVAQAAAFVCRAEITTRSGARESVSGWMHAGSMEGAVVAWRARVRGQHRATQIASQQCTLVRGTPHAEQAPRDPSR